jgi:anti-sigma factor RsiW
VTDGRHPDVELTAYAAEAFTPAERARVEAHLDACADCRRAVQEHRAVLAALTAEASAPPSIDWGRYQADLRARRERAGPRRWWAGPWPAVLGAGVAAAVVLLAVHGFDRRPAELATVEETVLGARLPMLQQYRVVERLDLLEDLDAIRQLDRFGHGS